MKWLVYYSDFYCQGKGEPNYDLEVIGYSNLDEKDLFKALQKEYPDLPIRKRVNVIDRYNLRDFETYDKNGVKDKYRLYESYVYFKENDLKEF